MAMSTPRNDRWFALSEYLDRALDLEGAELAAWLDALDTDEPSTAAEIRALLEAHEELRRENFLEFVPLAPAAVSLAGQTLGAYTLVSPIGQGGMGSVWLAERSDGRFAGQVAVKLLNLALIGRAGEERFRREGSILARLTHPHIAHLLDAGVSPHGQPYLVLEYVGGEHIDQYCLHRRLGVDARVRLFLDVLAAVAHAHANLIVHRDLKPSNVLVRADGQVKLLDFGVAKLLERDARSAGATLTVDGGRALTPEYAAPEQMTGGTITTATDVYALGVLLYVLLCGRHPAGPAEQTPADLLKAIVDVEPPPVSTVAGGRGIAPDLDVVVMKALKKKPQERYASVSAFADDLRRCLEHQPIAARPDTLSYRANRFVRRHRRGVAGATAAAVALASLIGFYTARLATERDRARLEAEKAAKVSELLTGLLTGADPYGSRDKQEPTVRELLDAGAEKVERDLGGQPELEAELLTVIGRVYQRLDADDKAQPLLEKALTLGRRTLGGDHVRLAQTLNDLGVLFRDKSEFDRSGPLLEEAAAMRRRLLGPDHKDLAVTLVELGRHYDDQGANGRAEALLREALAIRRRSLGDIHRETATSQNELGLLLWRKGEIGEAESLLRQALSTNRRVLRADHPNIASSLNNLGLIVVERGRYAEAESLFREALALDRKTLGPGDIDVATHLNNLSQSLREQGKYDEAAAALQEALDIARSTGGPNHPSVGAFATNLGAVYLAQGRPADAEPLLREALRVRRRGLPETDWRIGISKSLLGASLTGLQRFDEAESLLREAAAVLKGTSGPQGRQAALTRERLAALDEARRKRR
jgi:tetratricopeptide (TPR) repeat protein